MRVTKIKLYSIIVVMFLTMVTIVKQSIGFFFASTDTTQSLVHEKKPPTAQRVSTDAPPLPQQGTHDSDHNEQEEKNDDALKPVDIFYHVYLPPNDPDGIQHSYNIVEEQLRQIGTEKSENPFDGNRVTASGMYGRDDVTFNYVTIGHPFNETFVDNLCDKYLLRCNHISHHDVGFEMLTQQIIIDFCKQEENDSHVVSYIHSKGALNRNSQHDRSRNLLTLNAISDQCMHRLSSNQCNVCGGGFKSVWGPIYWGNMWSAQCSYVKKLMSPFEIEEKYNHAVQTVPKGIEMTMYSSEYEFYAMGKDRYAAEVFIGTHPSMIPCSVNRAENSYWSENPFGAFSNHVIPPANNVELLDRMVKDETNHAHLKEWYLLPGVLWRYYVFYNELPPDDSWVWRHYPHGQNWKSVVQNMGFPEALYHQIEKAEAK